MPEEFRQELNSKNANADRVSTSDAESERASSKLLQELQEDFLSDKNIVRLDSRSAKYCPDAKDGDICKMNQQDAEKYCQEQGGHLPSTREFATAMNPKAILEIDYVEKELKGIAPAGFYKVQASMDKNGKVDSFYYNNDMVARKLTGELAKNSFWTSSIVMEKPAYAHVFYGPLGGGGGPAEEHARSFKHAVLIIKDSMPKK